MIRIKKEHIELKDSGNTFEPTFTQAWRNANKIEEDITLKRDDTGSTQKRKMFHGWTTKTKTFLSCSLQYQQKTKTEMKMELLLSSKISISKKGSSRPQKKTYRTRLILLAMILMMKMRTKTLRIYTII